MKRRDLLIIAFLAGSGSLFGYVSACAPFVDSPFSDQVLSPQRDWNTQSMNRLAQTDIESSGTTTIAIVADVHQNYADLDQIIYEINHTPGVGFIANLGDMSNSGYNVEYDQFMDSFTSFHQPAVTAIGNHDSIGSGPKIYRKIFGPKDFYFESTSRRYIFFNTANLENPSEFEPNWLQDAVNSSTKPIFIFTHCSLQDPERFAGTPTGDIFNSVINDSRVQLVVNGHLHVYGLETVNNTQLLQVARAQGNYWVLLQITGNQLTVTQMDTGTQEVVTLK